MKLSRHFRYLWLSATEVLFLLSGCSRNDYGANRTAARLNKREFQSLLQTVADGWNSNRASLAADCFADDAIYSAPPDAEIRRGKRQLFDFFGGGKGRDQPMQMKWHHVIFDEEQQIGVGEYTFTYRIRTHGVVVVRIVNGKIANWREYEKESPLEWKQFVGENLF